MKLINAVHMSGFVATEPQQSGRGPHRFRLAHGGGKKKDGTNWPTQFFSVSVWDTKIVPKKGQWVELWGKLRQNDYTDKSGDKRQSVEIVAEAIQIEGKEEAKQPDSGTMVNLHGLTVSDADIPF
jgi:single-stranded DNA-binding protein